MVVCSYVELKFIGTFFGTFNIMKAFTAIFYFLQK